MSTVRDERGSLTSLEVGREVPFPIRRIFFLHDLTDRLRGAHAHRSCHQLILVLAGAADLVLDDGTATTMRALRLPDEGCYVPPMTWLTLQPVAPGTIVLVLASMPYDESDYIRDHELFRRSAQMGRAW